MCLSSRLTRTLQCQAKHTKVLVGGQADGYFHFLFLTLIGRGRRMVVTSYAGRPSSMYHRIKTRGNTAEKQRYSWSWFVGLYSGMSMTDGPSVRVLTLFNLCPITVRKRTQNNDRDRLQNTTSVK